MTLPQKFMDELAEQLTPFCGKGHAPRKLAETVVGKVGRVSFVVPDARPFANSMWAALAESDRARRAGKRESPSRTSSFEEIQQWRQVASRPPHRLG